MQGGDGRSTVERVANQFYYRTGALAEFLVELRKRDPAAIVFVTSDHLPPIVGGSISYRHDARQNICALFAGDRRVPLADGKTFHVPYRLAEQLHGQPMPVPPPNELEALYFAAIAAGMGH